MSVDLRPATVDDAAAISTIYNHYVATSHVTFDLEPTSAETFVGKLSGAVDGPHQVVVAVDAEVVGYATSKAFRPKPAYAPSVETSVYVSADHLGHGYGEAVYRYLLERLDGVGVNRAFAGVALPNDASDRLHRLLGFSPIGVFTQAGHKFDQWWDVAWYERPCGLQ